MSKENAGVYCSVKFSLIGGVTETRMVLWMVVLNFAWLVV